MADAHGGSYFPPPSYRVLDSVQTRLSDDELVDVKRRLGEALRHFEPLEGETVTVACRRKPGDDHSRWNPYAQADPVNRLIRIPTHERCSNVTLFHELGHLAIRRENEQGADLPASSEEFCSLYSIARQPAELIDEGRIPYIGEPEIPQADWPRACKKALEYRENHHAYIQQARKWLGITGEGLSDV